MTDYSTNNNRLWSPWK